MPLNFPILEDTCRVHNIHVFAFSSVCKCLYDISKPVMALSMQPLATALLFQDRGIKIFLIKRHAYASIS